MMKKAIFFLMVILINGSYHSQTESANVGISNPVPSISSLSTYTNIPVSVQTGVPDISAKLFSIPTNNKYLNIDVGLSYHSGNLTSDSWIGDLGSGWSLFGQGVISREISNDFDESFDDAGFAYYVKNPFDDIYIFNIPGETAKFRLIRDTYYNTFSLITLSPTTAKIEYTRNSNTATFIFDSFTITNDKGIKFKFQEFGLDMMPVFRYNLPNLTVISSKQFRSAFYLTSISDENDQELVRYTYIKDYKYIGASSSVERQINKISTIEIKDRAIIQFGYDKNVSLNNKHDQYSIRDITLKTYDNRFVSKYKMLYGDIDGRVLQSLNKVDVNENIVEKTSYEYDGVSKLNSAGFSYALWPIKRVKLPTGGAIQYDFEMVPHDLLQDKWLLRINRIKYFNDTNLMTAPSKTEEYNYDYFNMPNVSSAYSVSDGTFDGTTPANPSIIYKNVKVSDGNGYTKYYFKAPDAYPEIPPGPDEVMLFWPNYTITRGGLIEKKEIYNNSNQKLSEDFYEYIFQESTSWKFPMINSGYAANFYVRPVWISQQRITSNNFLDSGIAQSQKEIFKTNNMMLEKEVTTNFDGTIRENSYKYAVEKNNQKLINANMTSIPLEVTSISRKNISDNGKLLSKTETKYDNAANSFPSSILRLDVPNNINSTEVIFNRYDVKGNLEQYTTKEGIPVTIVWGYQKTQPIAKIEGATYSQVSAYITDMVNKSNLDIDAASEKNLITALDAFRNNSALSAFRITTYTYDPLIGATTSTPPSGIREYYKYDSANRLKSIIDEKGNILREHQYNYKN